MNKKTLNKFALSLFLSVSLASTFFPKPIIAQYYSEQTNRPSIVVDKKVRPISDSKFYDNLTANQVTFVDGDQIEFSIVVSNKGNINITNIKLVDYLPKYVTLLFFPGQKNQTNSLVETTIDNLNPGESKEYLIRARISDVPSSVSSNKLLQLTNKACASSTVASDCDNAKYFIGLSSSPKTGSEDMIAKTLIAISLATLAATLRRVARGY